MYWKLNFLRKFNFLKLKTDEVIMATPDLRLAMTYENMASRQRHPLPTKLPIDFIGNECLQVILREFFYRDLRFLEFLQRPAIDSFADKLPAVYFFAGNKFYLKPYVYRYGINGRIRQ